MYAEDRSSQQLAIGRLAATEEELRKANQAEFAGYDEDGDFSDAEDYVDDIDPDDLEEFYRWKDSRQHQHDDPRDLEWDVPYPESLLKPVVTPPIAGGAGPKKWVKKVTPAVVQAPVPTDVKSDTVPLLTPEVAVVPTAAVYNASCVIPTQDVFEITGPVVNGNISYGRCFPMGKYLITAKHCSKCVNIKIKGKPFVLNWKAVPETDTVVLPKIDEFGYDGIAVAEKPKGTSIRSYSLISDAEFKDPNMQDLYAYNGKRLAPGHKGVVKGNVFVHDCPTEEGWSGCPLLSAAGHVVGVHLGGFTSTHKNTAFLLQRKHFL
jgi:hypothetical protein